ncbi:hypothetical protein C8J57DRAFT_1580554 [Mycena rebaudengoi]|nr:hypothetical protein C8J57DRAFT_1580554 [Mycena rebaudengoi]
MTTSDYTLSSGNNSTLLQEKREHTWKSHLLNNSHGIRRAIKHAAGLRTLVFVMYGFLVAMHLGLLIISHYGLERRVRVPVGRPTTVLSLAISISSQTFAIVYLAAVLYLTQRLALRRILRSGTRTLTSIHDKEVAWSGLGSAVNAWWNQLSIPASIWGVGIITMYLTLTAGLKVTTPALFRLVPANQTASFAANSTLSSPFLHALLILMGKGDRTKDEFGLGLQNNMLYDVAAADTGPGTTTLNTYTMNVTCVTSTTPSISQRNKDSTTGAFYWNIERSPIDLYSIAETAPNVLRIAPPPILPEDPDHGYESSKIDIHGSVNDSDTSGKVASQVVLNPPMNCLFIGNYQQFFAPGYKQSKPPQSSTPKMERSLSAGGADIFGVPCAYLTQAERALMDKLSIYPPELDAAVKFPSSLEKYRDVPVANVMLHDLENALEDYAAAFYWSLTCLRNSPTIQEVQVTGFELVSQLQFDTLPVVVRTIFSIALLLISPILVGFRPPADKRKENIDFDTLGVLETVWLAGAESAVTAVEIPPPSICGKRGCWWKHLAANGEGKNMHSAEDLPREKPREGFSKKSSISVSQTSELQSTREWEERTQIWYSTESTEVMQGSVDNTQEMNGDTQEPRHRAWANPAGIEIKFDEVDRMQWVPAEHIVTPARGSPRPKASEAERCTRTGGLTHVSPNRQPNAGLSLARPIINETKRKSARGFTHHAAKCTPHILRGTEWPVANRSRLAGCEYDKTSSYAFLHDQQVEGRTRTAKKAGGINAQTGSA